jgi:hypothetical protein
MVMAEVQRLQMLKECECGHKFVEHEKCDDIRPCFHFTKDGDSGINLSVCSCKDYKEKKVSVPITP